MILFMFVIDIQCLSICNKLKEGNTTLRVYNDGNFSLALLVNLTIYESKLFKSIMYVHAFIKLCLCFFYFICMSFLLRFH